MATTCFSDAMSMPDVPHASSPLDGGCPRASEPVSLPTLVHARTRRTAGLKIPFGLKTPVEGANLSPEDKASAAARRPSPGFRPLRPTPDGGGEIQAARGGATRLEPGWRVQRLASVGRGSHQRPGTAPWTWGLREPGALRGDTVILRFRGGGSGNSLGRSLRGVVARSSSAFDLVSRSSSRKQFQRVQLVRKGRIHLGPGDAGPPVRWPEAVPAPADVFRERRPRNRLGRLRGSCDHAPEGPSQSVSGTRFPKPQVALVPGWSSLPAGSFDPHRLTSRAAARLRNRSTSSSRNRQVDDL